MYLDETYTFKTRRKDTAMLVTSLLFLSVLCPTLAGNIRTCPENCKCYVDSEYSPYSFSTAECDNLTWKMVYYPNILQLKLRPASNADQCHLANFTAKLFPKLEKLNLSNCSLTSIPSSGTNNFNSLYWIDVSNNSIRSVAPNALDSYRHISQIVLSNNALDPLSPPALNSSTVTQLVMDSCGIQTLLPQTFAGMPKLKYLSLSNNSLHFLHERTFPAGLLDLDLSKNRIVNVPMNEFLRLRSLSQLNLSANPVNCTCELVRFQDYLSQRVIFVDGMTCAYPHKYVGRKSSHVRENDLCDAAQYVDSSSSQEKCVPGTNSICNNGAVIDEDYVNDQGGAGENERALQQDELMKYQGDEAAKSSDAVEGSGDDGITDTDKPLSGTEEKQTSSPATSNETITVLESSTENTTIAKNDVLKMVHELGNNSTDSSVVAEGTTIASVVDASSAPSSTSLNESASVSSTLESAPASPDTTSTEPSSNNTSESSSTDTSSSTSEITSIEPSGNATGSSSTESASTSEITSIEPSSNATGSSSTESASTSEITSVEPSGNATGSSSTESSSTSETESPPSDETSNSSTNVSSTASESPSTVAPLSSEPSGNISEGVPTELATTSESQSTELPNPEPTSPSSTSESSSNVTFDTAPVTTLPPVAPISRDQETALSSGNSDGENKTLYGYLIPGIALLLIAFVCLAVYCSQCASKVATYKTDTNVEGAELQEVSLLPDSNHPTIVKHTSKYPGEKENGQTERLMSDHEQTNGGSAVIAEVNGNDGSQHSDETIECCKLTNGHSSTNQKDLGNVQCTVVKVTTLPDSVPKTAVIRDL